MAGGAGFGECVDQYLWNQCCNWAADAEWDGDGVPVGDGRESERGEGGPVCSEWNLFGGVAGYERGCGVSVYDEPGGVGAGQEIQFTSTGTNTSDTALTFDATGAYLYVARLVSGVGNSRVASYGISNLGVPTPVDTVVTGDAPFSVMIDHSGTYLYTANRGSGNISGYTIANGVLTALPGSPYASGLSATALAEDNTQKYVIAAAANGSNDYTMYSFDALSAGKLDAVSVGASGTDPAGSIAIAATH